MSETEEILHVENLCALVLAILNAKPLSAEMAFAKLANPGIKRQTDYEGMELLRKAGHTWKEVGELLEMNYPQSAYCHRKKRKAGNHGNNSKNQEERKKQRS